jgi:hypothetical protein
MIDMPDDSIAARSAELNDRYVRVVGVFDARNFGSFSAWNGAIERIRSAEAWGKRF